jgi:predicted nucleotidyltransferase
MNPDYSQILRSLADGQVQFILVGGVAANVHGSAHATFHIDVVYARNRENFRRILEALKPHEPYLRGTPPGLPFRWDKQTLRNGLNFTLTTKMGDVDLLGEVTGGGSYDQLLPHTLQVELFGVMCQCVTLQRLIQLKRAAGRPKDLDVIAELQALLEERNCRGSRR